MLLDCRLLRRENEGGLGRSMSDKLNSIPTIFVEEFQDLDKRYLPVAKARQLAPHLDELKQISDKYSDLYCKDQIVIEGKTLDENGELTELGHLRDKARHLSGFVQSLQVINEKDLYIAFQEISQGYTPYNHEEIPSLIERGLVNPKVRCCVQDEREPWRMKPVFPNLNRYRYDWLLAQFLDGIQILQEDEREKFTSVVVPALFSDFEGKSTDKSQETSDTRVSQAIEPQTLEAQVLRDFYEENSR